MKASPHMKNASLLRRLSVKQDLFLELAEICSNCGQLVELELGEPFDGLNPDGSLWPPPVASCPLRPPDLAHHNREEEETQAEPEEGGHQEGEEEFELDVRIIAENLHQLKSLTIGHGLQLVGQPNAPPILDHLLHLQQLRLCPLKSKLDCDTSRNEWSLRILAQSSRELKLLDLRGCYLKILSLGWLKTRKLEALHLYYQVPAASVLYKLAQGIKYLTLAHINTGTREFRSMGPVDPREELDACLLVLANLRRPQLLQVDLCGSHFSPEPFRLMLDNCTQLEYLDTRLCEGLESQFRVRCVSREQIKELFKV